MGKVASDDTLQPFYSAAAFYTILANYCNYSGKGHQQSAPDSTASVRVTEHVDRFLLSLDASAYYTLPRLVEEGRRSPSYSRVLRS